MTSRTGGQSGAEFLGMGSGSLMFASLQLVREGAIAINLALMPGFGGTQRLTRVVGRSAAPDRLLTGRQISAHEALRPGLVNPVVPFAVLRTEARAFAVELAATPAVASRYILEAGVRGSDLPLDHGETLEAALFNVVVSTNDTREGSGPFSRGARQCSRGRSRR